IKRLDATQLLKEYLNPRNKQKLKCDIKAHSIIGANSRPQILCVYLIQLKRVSVQLTFHHWPIRRTR
uniref:Uncharacterized protein n=1 Tax=Oryza brachyantha TaxID=4533 RepID=J3N288_ORYBR